MTNKDLFKKIRALNGVRLPEGDMWFEFSQDYIMPGFIKARISLLNDEECVARCSVSEIMDFWSNGSDRYELEIGDFTIDQIETIISKAEPIKAQMEAQEVAKEKERQELVQKQIKETMDKL